MDVEVALISTLWKHYNDFMDTMMNYWKEIQLFQEETNLFPSCLYPFVFNYLYFWPPSVYITSMRNVLQFSFEYPSPYFSGNIAAYQAYVFPTWEKEMANRMDLLTKEMKLSGPK
jgi:hypothetical protein